MAQVKITVRPNGPVRVEAPEGAVELVDVNGTQYDLTGKTAFSLCRRGGSVNKPFCDGTHSKFGFQDAERLPQKRTGYPVLLHELVLGREDLARLQFAPHDLAPQVTGDQFARLGSPHRPDPRGSATCRGHIFIISTRY